MCAMSVGSEVDDEGVSRTVKQRILDHAHLHGLESASIP
jgi:hypothetical protein